jgi:hypothetical protein
MALVGPTPIHRGGPLQIARNSVAIFEASAIVAARLWQPAIRGQPKKWHGGCGKRLKKAEREVVLSLRNPAIRRLLIETEGLGEVRLDAVAQVVAETNVTGRQGIAGSARLEEKPEALVNVLANTGAVEKSKRKKPLGLQVTVGGPRDDVLQGNGAHTIFWCV